MRVKVKATDLLSACSEAKPYTKARGLVVDTAIVLRRDAGVRCASPRAPCIA